MNTLTRLTRRVALAVLVSGAAVGCFTAPALADPDATKTPDSRTCGAFSAINNLAQESLWPEPGPASYEPRKYDLVGLANALNIVDKQGLSTDMNSALTDYIYALAELGAAINHHEPADGFNLASTEREMINRCGPTSGYIAFWRRDVSARPDWSPEDPAPGNGMPDKRSLPDDPASPGR